MLHNKLVYIAVAVALLGLPNAALAQQQGGEWNRDFGNVQQSDRDAHARQGAAQRYDNDRRDADAHRDADDRRDTEDRRDNGDRRDRDRNNDGRSYGNGRYDGNDRSGRLNGRVASFGGFNMSLRNGQQVHLHQGTIIEPTGTTLRRGMNLAISGHGNGDGSFEADRIVVLGDNGR